MYVLCDGFQVLYIVWVEELLVVIVLVVFYKISLFDLLEICEFYKLVCDIDKVFFNSGNLNLGLIIVFFEVYLNVDYID